MKNLTTYLKKKKRQEQSLMEQRERELHEYRTFVLTLDLEQRALLRNYLGAGDSLAATLKDIHDIVKSLAK